MTTSSQGIVSKMIYTPESPACRAMNIVRSIRMRSLSFGGRNSLLQAVTTHRSMATIHCAQSSPLVAQMTDQSLVGALAAGVYVHRPTCNAWCPLSVLS